MKLKVMIIIGLLITSSARATDESKGVLRDQQDSASQSAAQSPELAEAEQLNAQVIKLYNEGKYDKALPLAERVLAIREKSLGSDHVLVATALRNLAELLSAKGKRKEAKSTFQRFITTYEKALAANDPKIAEALDHYVCLLVGSGETEEALEVQKRLYKVENGFDYDESANLPGKKLALGGLMARRLISSPRRSYPAEAKSARVTGSVVMKIRVDEAGKVVSVKTLCGHPILAKASEESILGAIYAPTVVAGKPVKVTGVAIYRFYIE